MTYVCNDKLSWFRATQVQMMGHIRSLSYDLNLSRSDSAWNDTCWQETNICPQIHVGKFVPGNYMSFALHQATLMCKVMVQRPEKSMAACRGQWCPLCMSSQSCSLWPVRLVTSNLTGVRLLCISLAQNYMLTGQTLASHRCTTERQNCGPMRLRQYGMYSQQDASRQMIVCKCDQSINQ